MIDESMLLRYQDMAETIAEVIGKREGHDHWTIVARTKMYAREIGYAVDNRGDMT